MTHRVLLVEDNRMNLQMLHDWLEAEGLEVETAESLAAARAVVLRQAPELILLDVRLGSEDGLDLARWVRATPELQSLPIIAVTAHALRHEQEQILQQGCDAVVSKPIDFRLLRRQLDLWLSAAREVRSSAGARKNVGEG
jgi:CheY-like chemotaxis protein